MTDSKPLVDAREVANKRDKELKATDFHPDQIVKVVETEGTMLEFVSAFYETWNDWLFVFSEHHPAYVQHRDEIVYAYQMKIISRFEP